MLPLTKNNSVVVFFAGFIYTEVSISPQMFFIFTKVSISTTSARKKDNYRILYVMRFFYFL